MPRILVVDDNRVVRNVLEMQLVTHGYEVTTASSGLKPSPRRTPTARPADPRSHPRHRSARTNAQRLHVAGVAASHPETTAGFQ